MSRNEPFGKICRSFKLLGQNALRTAAAGFFLLTAGTVSGGNLSVLHANESPTRLARGPEGKIYATDPEAGSVFIYDSSLNLTGELKNLNFPLGIAVGVDGRIYVGCQGTRSVQVYDADGEFITYIGKGDLKKPNDIAIDLYGNLYIADSTAHRVRIYNMDGGHLGDLGSYGRDPGEFKFPIAVDVAYRTNAAQQAVGELFVADQGNFMTASDQEKARVQVFSLSGNLLRVITPNKVGDGGGWFNPKLQEDEVSTIQSIAVDDQYRIHLLDLRFARVVVLDAVTGFHAETYGAPATSTEYLNLPLDLLITDPANGTNSIVVANSGVGRIEIKNRISTLGDIQLSAAPVAENVPTGTTVGTFSLTPAPAGPVTYKLVEGTWPYDNAFFAISNGTNLVTAQPLDYEQITNLQIRVKAVGPDAQNLILAQTLALDVTDANEAPTDFGLSSWYVLEGQPSNTLVGTFVGVDQDAGETLSYSLVSGEGDTGNQYFTVNGANLMTLAPFDYSVTNRYSIRARVSDSAGHSLTYIFDIDVYPVNSVGEADLDGDGISDWWEADFDLYITDLDPASDTDGDGVSDWDEWVAGTDPINPEAFFRIEESSFNNENAKFVLYWRSHENRSYSVYWSTNLTESLQLLTNGLQGTPPWNSYTDTVYSADQEVFYRLKVEHAQ